MKKQIILKRVLIVLAIIFLVLHLFITYTAVYEIKNNNGIFQFDTYIFSGENVYLYGIGFYNFLCFIGFTWIILVAEMIILHFHNRYKRENEKKAITAYRNSVKKHRQEEAEERKKYSN